MVNAADAASAEMAWKAIDRYSTAYAELQATDKVKFYKTPNVVLLRQLDAYDSTAAKKAVENPLFREVLESQKQFAARAVKWELDTVIGRRMAYQHYFGEKRPTGKS